MTLTDEKIIANQLNAMKSTGPKTFEGKLAITQNPLKHGICSVSPVVKDESELEWEEYRDALLIDLSPVGCLEWDFANKIAVLSWRLNRVFKFEVQSSNMPLMSMNPETLRKGVIVFPHSHDLTSIQRYETHLTKKLMIFLNEFIRLKKLRSDTATESLGQKND